MNIPEFITFSTGVKIPRVMIANEDHLGRINKPFIFVDYWTSESEYGEFKHSAHFFIYKDQLGKLTPEWWENAVKQAETFDTDRRNKLLAKHNTSAGTSQTVATEPNLEDVPRELS